VNKEAHFREEREKGKGRLQGSDIPFKHVPLTYFL
jgi:hypothetical protein